MTLVSTATQRYNIGLKCLNPALLIALHQSASFLRTVGIFLLLEYFHHEENMICLYLRSENRKVDKNTRDRFIIGILSGEANGNDVPEYQADFPQSTLLPQKFTENVIDCSTLLSKFPIIQCCARY